jgi:hypothetical protein
MKKIFVTMLLTLATTGALAHGYYGGYGYRNNWVAPAIIGGVVGYNLARPYYAQPVIIQQPVYVQPPVYIQQSYPNNGFHQETILDANCNCYRIVWLPNN